MLQGDASLLRLMTLFSPVFPVGGFAYSHGLEQTVHENFIQNAEDLFDWLDALANYGSLHNDVVLIAEAWRSTGQGQSIIALVEIANSNAASKERFLEIDLQGRAFCTSVAQTGFSKEIYKALPYPVAVGVIGHQLEISLPSVLTAYLHTFLSNLVQAAIRLVPLGQSDGVKIMAKLEKTILAITENSDKLTLDNLGSCCFLSDIMAMRHETLYSRIFRS
ncbi:urease accessory protein UreF [Bartonella apihabitans]|uniref:urease accessory protein UreF n=1 Tax=uncultured Bartonella sp. TaxID=104108 RepID=UPI0025F4D640|nr:urease accessory protein UreF [Bartonella apihabitans]WLT08307.1 urease accessory protein UreF [Bartonella apihabitans]